MFGLKRKQRPGQSLNEEWERRTNPLHRLLASLLEQAIHENASAIAIGYRRHAGDIESWYSQWMQSIERLSSEEGEFGDAMSRSSRITGPAEKAGVPVWFLSSQGLQAYLPLPTSAWGRFVFTCENQLVSLKGTKEKPQPARFIEISPTPDRRRFVEVDLELDRDNLFWIRLRSVRLEPPSVHVSSSYY